MNAVVKESANHNVATSEAAVSALVDKGYNIVSSENSAQIVVTLQDVCSKLRGGEYSGYKCVERQSQVNMTNISTGVESRFSANTSNILFIKGSPLKAFRKALNSLPGCN
ncbi:MAG TPA: hypothetical protein VNJ08_13600 [Bacteriovoracaceae bacterium]|nr:hypothetical protein [Bacteriovoracaceae bacterium]